MHETARLKGEVALVTGASRGIGAAVAARLSAEGARVVGTATVASRSRSFSAAGTMRELCAGTLIGSAIARFAPSALAAATARDTAGALPAITTWPGALKFTASTTSP